MAHRCKNYRVNIDAIKIEIKIYTKERSIENEHRKSESYIK